MDAVDPPPPPPPLHLLVRDGALPPRALAAASCVCRSWRAAAETAWESGWRTLVLDGEAESGRVLRVLGEGRRRSLAPLRSLSLLFSRGLCDEDLQLLARCAPRLEVAHLDGCQSCGDEGVGALTAACGGLRTLSLYWNVKVTRRVAVLHPPRRAASSDTRAVALTLLFHSASMRALAASPCAADSLTSLCLSGCKRIQDDGLCALLAAAPHLRSLNLTRCLSLSDATLNALAHARCAVRLEELILYAGGGQYGQPALCAALVSTAGSLRRLDLCGCECVGDEAMASLSGAAAGLSLEVLNLTWCQGVSDAGLVPLLRRAPKLSWLSVHGNLSVTGEVLQALEASCKGALAALDVRGCTGIPGDQRTPKALRERLPALRHFALHS